MARKDKYISRTIKTTDCTVMCIADINKDTPTIERRHFTIVGTHEANDATLTLVKKANTDVNIIPSKVLNCEIKEVIYEMTETEFLKHARICTRRHLDTDNTTTVEGHTVDTETGEILD